MTELLANISFGAMMAVGLLLIGGFMLVAVMNEPRNALHPEGRMGRLRDEVLALAGYPLLAPLHGRGWWQAEVFGFAPDPTAMLTLGALVFWRAPWPLWVIPLLWCAASSATLRELHAAQPWWPAAAALLALGAVWWGRLRR